jgi:ABC-type spermidine/putrescine transport system permease subunit II
MRENTDPTVAAAAVVLICTTLVFIVGFAILSRRRGEEAA